MRSKEEIEATLMEELERAEPDNGISMELEEWGYSHGWIEALRWVLNDCSIEIDNNKKNLTEGANDETIKQALNRLSKEWGFGRKDNASNSSNDSIRDGWINATQKCEP